MTCSHCKAKGYSADKCTLPQWIFQKPEDITKVLKKNGKNYHWCTKCNCFRIHDTAGHDKWKSSPASQHSGCFKKKNNSKKKTSDSSNSEPSIPTTPSANVAVDTDSDDEDGIQVHGGLCKTVNLE